MGAHKKTEPTTDINIRLGTETLERMTAVSEMENIDRSAWTNGVLLRALERGLDRTVLGKDLIDWFRRDARALFRVNSDTARRVFAESNRLKVPVSYFVAVAVLSELESL